MINIIKDIFNFNNWIIVFKKPRYAKEKLIIRFLSYPSKRIANIKSRILRNLIVDFWTYLAKKNKNFNTFFFKNNKSFNNVTYSDDYKNNYKNISEKTIDSLKINGVAILENILSKDEHLKIKQNFKNLNHNTDSDNYNWIEKPKDISKSNQVKLLWALDNINNYNTIKKVNSDLTKLIFGKECYANLEYFVHKPKELPENIIKGDNHLHMDRFLPNMKLYYSPFEIKKNDAPFSYVKGSHIITQDYINYWKNSTNWDEYDDLKIGNEYLKSKIKNLDYSIPLKENCLIAAFTNGLHGRSPFLTMSERNVVFITYNSFNKLSLMNPKNFN